MIEFCTYFDHRYLPRAIALYRSLKLHAGPFRLWVLCLSEECARVLSDLDLPDVYWSSLQELEDNDPQLLAAKPSRTAVEYYFTCTPCWTHYLMSKHAEIEMLTYLDSDLWFLSDPSAIFRELSGKSVGIVPHRFTARSSRSHGKYGKYNVGWVTFKRDENGLACLRWWRAQCLAWCFDRLEDGKYADQRYLDAFETLVSGVHSITNVGANLAPWNVADYAIGVQGATVTVDGHPLIFYHFQGLRPVGLGFYNSNLTAYGARLTGELRRRVYEPYLLALSSAESDLQNYSALARAPLARSSSRWLGKWRAKADRLLSVTAAALRGNLLKMPAGRD